MVWERFLGDERRVKNWVTFFLCIVTGVWAQIISRCNIVRDDATRICAYPFNANYASLFASLLKRVLCIYKSLNALNVLSFDTHRSTLHDITQFTHMYIRSYTFWRIEGSYKRTQCRISRDAQIFKRLI